MSRQLDYLRKLPSFDVEWSDEVKDAWMECFALLVNMDKSELVRLKDSAQKERNHG